MKYRYTKNELEIAIKYSKSLRETMIKLKIVPAGGNYRTLKRLISENNLSTSHFTGQGWNKGKKSPPKYNISVYLTNKRFIQSYKLKNRLLKEGIIPKKCYRCNRKNWLNIQIPLELHHKDGNYRNNNLENLELLCPNCHALTNNYRGRKISI